MSNISLQTEKHILGILKLLQTSFPHETKYSKDYLDWLYVRNPCGVTISANLIEGDNVLASYAVLPMKYKFAGSYIDAALSLNTATHPSVRGRGWFPKLANIVYEKAASDGKDVVIGVANENSIRGLIKYLGFDLIGNVSLRLASTNSHLSTFKKLGIGSGFSEEYMRWRLDNPSAQYSGVRVSDGCLLVATRWIPVVIGSLNWEHEDLPINRILSFGGIAPCYLFSSLDYGFKIPRRILPSPWHLVVKNLRLPPGEYNQLTKSLAFCGIDSDTF